MNSATITQMPTLCVPEKLDKKALVAHVNYLQESILTQGQQLSDACVKLREMNVLAHNLSEILYAMIDCYEDGNQAAILLQVKQLSEKRRTYKKMEVH